MKNNNYALIMAGGVGSRFWPVSRESFPKQFHDLLGSGKSLLQSTFDRLEKIVPAKNIYILTNEMYQNLVLDQLNKIGKDQLILEPAMRNTAPCLLLAGLKIHKQNPNAKIIVAPSDHWIEDENTFVNNVKTAWQNCDDEKLMTMGIPPTFPNTGYGYIEFREEQNSKAFEVKRFTEKPDYETAKKFYESGNYLWNSGMFLWKASAIVKAFELHAHTMFKLFNAGYDQLNTAAEKKFLAENYPKSENISIDFAIMENAKKIGVVKAGFDWNDLGTWGSLYDQLPKNDQQNVVIHSDLSAEDSSGNMIRSKAGKKVVIDGLQDFIVVDSDDVLMIAPRSKEQTIKQKRNKAIENYGEKMK
jgi:mannose-1-phosphate guanylyltransferase